MLLLLFFLPLVRHQVDEAPVGLLRLEKKKPRQLYRVRGAHTQHLLPITIQMQGRENTISSTKKK